jgi:hypothetical protein
LYFSLSVANEAVLGCLIENQESLKKGGTGMSKPVLGLVLGGVLGIVDGLTAWFTPDVRPYMLGIVLGSTFKGLVAGILIGFFARKFNSLPLGIVVGLAIGLVLAFIVAAMPSATGKHYYFEIMLPGSILGLIVGFATQKYGRPSPQPASAVR